MRQLVTLIAIVLSLITFTSTVQATETITYYHNDLLGSPIASTNETGGLVWKETYKPYGERVINDPESADNTLWYTGKAHDDETGLSYFGARYYDPIVGRFMAVDPVGFQESNPASFNRYAYANNNPYKHVDPDGEFPVFLLAFAAYDFYDAYQATGSITQAAGAAALGVINPFGKVAKAAKNTVQAGGKLGDRISRQRGALGESSPTLKRIHSDKTITSGSNRYSFDYWGKQSTDDIVRSLRPGKKDALKTKSDGRIFDGNTRIKVLQDRGFDVNSLSREVLR